MFERFSKEAREAVVLAQEIGRDTGTRAIDTRHVVVALAKVDGPASDGLRAAGTDPARLADTLVGELCADGLDPEALASLGIDLAVVRDRADAAFGARALDRAARPAGHLRFGRDAKKALELALRECIRLGTKRIDSRHLLLGVLRADCPGRDALATAGVDLDALRHALEVPGMPDTRSA